MKCRNCKCELSMVGLEMPVFVFSLRLMVECPACKYRMYINVVDGWVKLEEDYT